MNDEGSITGREYYEIFVMLEEYCRLKKAELESSTTPHYIKDLGEIKLQKAKDILKKMDKRMEEFPSEYGCCAK